MGNIMKKQKTLLIIVLIVAIAMLGIYVAIGFMADKKAGTPKTAETMLTDLEDVTYAQYTNPGGTVTLVKANEEWTCEENAELVLVHGFVDEKMEVLSKIEGTVVNGAKKADCGLEEPSYTLTIKDADTTVKLSVGIGEDYVLYAMVDGDDAIYTIHDNVAEVLHMAADEFSEPSDDMSSYYLDMEEEETLEGDEGVSEEENYDVIVEDEPVTESETETETETEAEPEITE